MTADYMRYFIELSYKGTNYHGWQVQNNAPSVQGELQCALSAILRKGITVTGAGRTDTGVHSLYYVAHFDVNDPVDDTKELCYHLNAMLPKDIAVKSIFKVKDDAHARFSAIEREYKYFMRNDKDPFSRETSWQYYVSLDTDAMNEAAEWLLRFDDFTSFAKLDSGNKTNICKVVHAKWEREGDCLVFTIRADRFLRNMVRAIVGTLVDVGRGKITPAQFGELIAAKDLSLSGTSAPAQGLFLSNVVYPEGITK